MREQRSLEPGAGPQGPCTTGYTWFCQTRVSGLRELTQKMVHWLRTLDTDSRFWGRISHWCLTVVAPASQFKRTSRAAVFKLGEFEHAQF